MVCGTGQARTEGEREESDGDISEDDGDEDDDDDIPYNPKVFVLSLSVESASLCMSVRFFLSLSICLNVCPWSVSVSLSVILSLTPFSSLSHTFFQFHSSIHLSVYFICKLSV